MKPQQGREPTLSIAAPVSREHEEVLTPGALSLVAKLTQELGPVRDRLLERRAARQRELDGGKLLDFLPETESVRHGDWRVAPPKADLSDRRVEITGPTDLKMVINALNSGANVFMADFEDANAPTWHNMVQGQVNLREAVDRTIKYTSPEGKAYALGERLATLMVRPRGLHLVEKHVLLGGRAIPGAFFDFGIFLFHNARKLLERGSGPYFYIPKLESHLEARLWNDIFNMAEEELHIPRGSIRATVLIETIPAAFEADEILFELKEHSAGLNCGRWDYIFSIIKKFHGNPRFTLPDRSAVTMTTHPMRSFSLLTIETCHRRGAHAMGGMAAQIPIKDDPRANEQALQKVREDKEREVSDGHDGTWVAHPGLVESARHAFDAHMPGPNQIDKPSLGRTITREDLLAVPAGAITEEGVRHNIDVGIQYMAAWLGGVGSVPLYNLMEDAATAEISRSQLWQWVHHPNAALPDGRRITPDLMHALFEEESEKIEGRVGGERFVSGHYEQARQLIERIVFANEFTEFMTTVGYQHLD